MVLLGSLVAEEGCNVLTSSGTREGDNVVFVRDPGNLFNSSWVKVSLSRTGVYTYFCHLEAKVTSILNLLGRDSARKSSVNAVYFAYYAIIT